MNQNFEREIELYEVLKATATTGYFTIGERIQINQERGYLLSIGSEEELRPYQLDATIEAKVQALKK